jgi:hypothetical protein
MRKEGSKKVGASCQGPQALEQVVRSGRYKANL